MAGNKPKAGRRRSNPFAPDHAPYGTYEGAPGSPAQWAGAFRERMSKEEIAEALNGTEAWAVLGVARDATEKEIRRAFLAKARQTHPDHNPQHADGEAFKRVRAAYEEMLGLGR